MKLTKVKIQKRLIYIKTIRKALHNIANTFTHKTSKRRDMIVSILAQINLLEREIKRDIRPDAD